MTIGVVIDEDHHRPLPRRMKSAHALIILKKEHLPHRLSSASKANASSESCGPDRNIQRAPTRMWSRRQTSASYLGSEGVVPGILGVGEGLRTCHLLPLEHLAGA